MGDMDREFHIVASACETRFTITADTGVVHFASLSEAARHARSSCDDGFVVISDSKGKAMSRIPFKIPG